MTKGKKDWWKGGKREGRTKKELNRKGQKAKKRRGGEIEDRKTEKDKKELNKLSQKYTENRRGW